MPLFTIKIDKVIIEANSEQLEEINEKLDRLLLEDDELKQRIIDKLDSAIDDIKSTV